MADFTKKQREKLADEKEAMPDGSYPIRNRSDLKNAIQAFGRSKNPEKTKAWIKKRARELDAEDLIPDSWKEVAHMDDSTYLVHYGVLGMKWGVRKDRNYKYTSMRTKHLTKKSEKAKAKGKKNAGKLAQKLKASKKIDKSLLSYAKKTSTGKALVQDLLLGPMGAKSYATMRATGSSRKKAIATQIISRSAGIGLGVLLGGVTGAAGASLTKYPNLVDQTNLLKTVMNISGKSAADADAVSKALSAVGKMSDNIYKSAIAANARSGSIAGAVVGDTAGASKSVSKKKKKK